MISQINNYSICFKYSCLQTERPVTNGQHNTIDCDTPIQ